MNMFRISWASKLFLNNVITDVNLRVLNIFSKKRIHNIICSASRIFVDAFLKVSYMSYFPKIYLISVW